MLEPAPIPWERLDFFSRRLGVDEGLRLRLRPFAQGFQDLADEVTEYLFRSIRDMTLAQIILRQHTSEQRLKNNWRGWFLRLWGEGDDHSFIRTVWRSGSLHVRYGVDHRIISMAYALVRRHLHSRIEEFVPLSDRDQVHRSVSQLLDLCLLVETDAFLHNSTHCEWEVMAGVAHQLRNPLTVIGGFAQKARREAEENSPVRRSMDVVLEQARRLERLVRNVEQYLHMLNTAPRFRSVSLSAVLEDVLERLSRESGMHPGRPHVDIPADMDQVEADPAILATGLFHLLQNAFEAAAGHAAPRVEVRSEPSSLGRPFLNLSIVNSGELPAGTDIERLYVPFHSDDPQGTGFGLPIARLAGRKNFGLTELLPGAGEITARMLLLRPGHVHQSGLFFSPGKS